MRQGCINEGHGEPSIRRTAMIRTALIAAALVLASCQMPLRSQTISH
jgi:hypothetical protein